MCVYTENVMTSTTGYILTDDGSSTDGKPSTAGSIKLSETVVIVIAVVGTFIPTTVITALVVIIIMMCVCVSKKETKSY